MLLYGSSETGQHSPPPYSLSLKKSHLFYFLSLLPTLCFHWIWVLKAVVVWRELARFQAQICYTSILKNFFLENNL